MSVTGALAILKLLLTLAAYFAKRAERHDIEKALLNELDNFHRDRVDAAAAARDSVRVSDGMPNPNQRPDE